MKLRLLIGICLLPAFALAQSKPTGNGNTVAQPRAMTGLDSLMVKQLFFSAMNAKVIENYVQAAELFNRVLQTDPNNDAALYQLSILKKLKENYTDAQGLLEKAVTIKPDNEWYWLG